MKKNPLSMSVNVQIKSALQEMYSEKKQWLNSLQYRYHYLGITKPFLYTNKQKKIL